MRNLRLAAWAAVGTALIAGAASDVVPARKPVYADGYRVLSADFHVHTFPLSASSLAPWDAVIEARHQGLDAIVVSGHNETWSGKAGRWFARHFGGPIVIAAEEIHGPRFHMVAVGIRKTISWRLSAVAAIDEIHRQGGVAIAAHPTESMWAPYLEGDAIHRLDGAEVWQPTGFSEPFGGELREFYERSGAAAIGSSDYHGLGRLGICRTLVFVKEASEGGVLEAIRAKRTVVIARDAVYGDRELASAVMADSSLLAPAAPSASTRFLAWVSRAGGILGLLCLVVAYHKK